MRFFLPQGLQHHKDFLKIAAFFLYRIRKPERRKEHHETERTVFKEIGEGLKAVFHHRILWSIAACNGTINLFNSALMSIAVLKEFDIS